MLTLNSIQKIRPFLVVIFVALILIFLIGVIILQFENNDSQPITDQFDATFGVLNYPEFIPKTLQRSVKSITVNIQNPPTTPRTIKVYKLEQPSNATQTAQNIAKHLGFSAQPIVDKNFAVWSENARTLSFDTTSGRVVFSSSFNPNNQKSIATNDEAISMAQKIIEGSPITIPSQTNVTLLKNEGSNFVSAENMDSADAFELDYYEKIDNYMVFGQSPKTGTLSIIIDRGGNLLKLETKLFKVNLNTSSTYPLKTFDESSLTVKTAGVVVETEIPGVDPLVGTTMIINSINLSKVELAYFIDLNNNLAIPIYVYKGSFTLSDKRQGFATVYLPAIKDKYLKL